MSPVATNRSSAMLAMPEICTPASNATNRVAKSMRDSTELLVSADIAAIEAREPEKFKGPPPRDLLAALRYPWTMECEGVCPYCGQPVSFFIDEGGLSRQRYVEDCSVCCRPIELEVE